MQSRVRWARVGETVWDGTRSDAARTVFNEGECPDGCATRRIPGGRGRGISVCYDGDWVRDRAYSSSWLMNPRFGCAFMRLDRM